MTRKTVYLDHSVIAKEILWPDIAGIFGAGPNVRLAISDWNILEIAAGTDHAQGIKRAAFLDSLKPLWMVERLSVAKWEARDYVWSTEFSSSGPAWNSFEELASVAMSHVMGSKVLLGLNVQKMVSIWHQDPANLDLLLAQRKQGTAAMKTLQATSSRDLNKKDREMFHAWIEGLLPVVDPTGKIIPGNRKAEILDTLYANQSSFFAACPTIWVEDEITKVRTQDPKRPAKDSDAVDLQHSLMALAKCDHFVCRDGFVVNCAEAVSKVVPTAKVHRSLDELTASL